MQDFLSKAAIHVTRRKHGKMLATSVQVGRKRIPV